MPHPAGLDAFTRSNAAALTAARLSRIEPELSTRMPIDTGTSSCRNEAMVWGASSSVTREVFAIEIRDQSAFFVYHGAVQQNLVHILLQGVDSILPFLNPVRLARIRRLRRRVVCRVRREHRIAIYIEARLRLRMRGIVQGGECLHSGRPSAARLLRLGK